MSRSKLVAVLRSLLGSFAHPFERRSARTPNRFRPQLECCEARDVPAAFVVNSGADLNDSDPGDGVAWTGNMVMNPLRMRLEQEVTLRAAIQEANALGVQLAAHTISYAPLTDGSMLMRPMDDIRVPLSITGNGKDATIITRGAGAGDFPFFAIATTLPNELKAAVTVGFAQLTIRDARGVPAQNQGGAIHNAGTLTLNHVDLRDNRAFQGGAIYNATTGVANLTNCVLANNQAVGAGADGGAIYTTGFGRITISDSILSGNSAITKGGAIHMNVHSRVTLFDTNLSNNTAVEGGALYASVGDADAIPFQMTGGRAWNNTAANGGAFYFSTTNARLDGVSIDNNSASDTGGAIFLKERTLVLFNCTFADNTATRLGPHLVYVGTLGTSVWVPRTNTPTLRDADLVQWVQAP